MCGAAQPDLVQQYILIMTEIVKSQENVKNKTKQRKMNKFS